MSKRFINTNPLDLGKKAFEICDPVLAHIYNSNVNQSGQPFTICRRHYAEMEARLGKKAPDCFLSILALMPVNQNCEHCEEETDTEETDAESLQ